MVRRDPSKPRKSLNPSRRLVGTLLVSYLIPQIRILYAETFWHHSPWQATARGEVQVSRLNTA